MNSECTNPQLEVLHIGVEPLNDDKTQLYTYLNGRIICDSDIRPTEATIVYTDKSSKAYTLVYTSEGDFYSDRENIILGNVEELALNSGHKHYRAVGKVLTPSMFSITGSSCLNPVFKRYRIRLYSDENNKIYNSGKVPNKAKFVGSIKNTTSSAEVNGELNVEWKNAVTMNLNEGTDDKAELDVSLQGKIKVPSRPEMILNLGFKNPTNINNFTLSYQYGTTVLNGKASFDEEMKNGTVEFTGTSGIKLLIKIEDGEILYGVDSPVTRNGRKIGELQDREGVPVIKYTDGSFESLP